MRNEKGMRKIKRLIVNIIKVIFQKVYHLFGKELEEEQWKVWVQFIEFSLVGVSNFLVNYLTYVLFLCFQDSYHVANFAGFILSVFNAFYWNNRFVFKQREEDERIWWKALLKTYVSYAFSGLLLTEILLMIEINVLGIPKLLGPVINLLITTPVNFLLNKFWAFREKNKS